MLFLILGVFVINLVDYSNAFFYLDKVIGTQETFEALSHFILKKLTKFLDYICNIYDKISFDTNKFKKGCDNK